MSVDSDLMSLPDISIRMDLSECQVRKIMDRNSIEGTKGYNSAGRRVYLYSLKELQEAPRGETRARRKAPVIKLNSRLPYFEVLDVLRKDKKHYLNNKSVQKWTNDDWSNFYKLKETPSEK